MLVSAFLAAAALAQTVGNAIGYEYTAMLFVEPDTATLAVIDSADGSITDVRRRPLNGANPVPELAAMIARLDAPESYAEGLFIVGCDVDIAPIKPALEVASYLPISAPEEPDMALARGAALASANAPLFASSTAALANAQDPGTGEVDPFAVSPGYLEVPVHRPGAELREEDLAYSAAPDQDADAETGVVNIVEAAAEDDFDTSQRPRPLMLVGSALAVVVVSAALALEIALALGIRPAVALRPVPGQALIAPAPGGTVTTGGPAYSGAAPAGHSCGAAAATPARSRADRSTRASARPDSRRTGAGARPTADARGDSRAASPRPVWPASDESGSSQAAAAEHAIYARAHPAVRSADSPAANEFPGPRGAAVPRRPSVL